MLDYLISNIWGGLIILVIGLLNLYITIFFVKKNVKSPLQPFTSGIVASICFIVSGVITIIMNLLGKW
jgi:hypothetical protein